MTKARRQSIRMRGFLSAIVVKVLRLQRRTKERPRARSPLMPADLVRCIAIGGSLVTVLAHKGHSARRLDLVLFCSGRWIDTASAGG